MDRAPSDVVCRVLHTVAVIKAMEGRCNNDNNNTPSYLSADPSRPASMVPVSVSARLPAEDAHTSQPSAHAHDDPSEAAVAVSRPSSSSHTSSSEAAELAARRSHSEGGLGTEEYLRRQRETLLHRERLLRQRVDANIIIIGDHTQHSSTSATTTMRTRAQMPARAPRHTSAPVHTVRVTSTTTHVAAQPYRRVYSRDPNPSTTHEVWLHMPSQPSSLPPPPRCGTERVGSGKPVTASLAVHATDPLASRWLPANDDYEHAYLRQEQRLQALRPDLWSRALPSYAALDGMPQLMDNDQSQTFSRVRRVMQDDGISFIQ